jgi:hypothetical protein
MIKRLRFGQVTAAAAQPSLKPQMAGTFDLGPQLGKGCRPVDLNAWQHPALQTIRQRKEAHLQWVQLCAGDSYPVFGADFDFDPQGQTKDFFYPLFIDTLQANQGRPLAFVAIKDRLLIQVRQLGPDQYDFNYAELDNPAATVWPILVAPPSAPQVPDKASPSANTIFTGVLGQDWLPYGAGGGNFQKFAREEHSMLVVDVPKGNNWGRTGLYSSKPVLQSPVALATQSARIRVHWDPERTTDAILSLVPAQNTTKDEWAQHHVRVGFHAGAETDTASLTLWIARQPVMRFELKNRTMDQFDLLVRPDGAVLLTDTRGQHLLQGILPDEPAEGGYRLFVLTGTARRGQPASLALQSVSLDYQPFTRQPAPDSLPDTPQEIVLFDQGVLGRWWQPYDARGTDFNRLAALTVKGLTVDVPAKSNRGRVGLFSAEPLVWLDRFGEGAEVALHCTFDPRLTTGFTLALSPLYNLRGNEPSRPSAWLQWNAKADGSGGVAALSLLPEDSKKPVWEQDLTAQAPREVILRLSPRGIRVEGLSLPSQWFSWEGIGHGRGLRVYAFSQPEQNNLPARMALQRIVLERTPGSPVPPPQPAPGVKPLSEKVVFSGQAHSGWEPADINGATFAQHGRFNGDALQISLPPDTYNWGKTGLFSKEPILDFNERILKTTYTLTLTTRPQETTGLQIMLSGSQTADMEKSSYVIASLIRHDSGRHAGQYLLSLSAGKNIYRTWSRAVDAAWVERHWNGKLELEFGKGWAGVGLVNGPRIRGTDFAIKKNLQWYMSVLASPPERRQGARLVLRSITGRWVPPQGMTAAERWQLVDDQDFDVDAFLDDVTETNIH